MTDHAGTPQAGAPRLTRLPAVTLLVASVALMVFAFRDPLFVASLEWTTEEYSHCYLIPFISLFLIATRGRELGAIPWEGSRAGPALILVAIVLLLLGNLSSVYTISQYGFIVAVWGAFLSVFGTRAVRLIWPALAYLVFMVPLPDFLEVKLSADLQLWSSRLGVAVIRLAGLPVYLAGNVIDLGAYQLEVAEACSGLRYLFPLMSFGFLCAVLYQAPLWQRAVVFLSTIPITVLMNSVRIGVIGILVNAWGPEQAEGFLHDFEGWVVFMACVGILFAEMYVMARLSGRRLLKSMRLATPPARELLRLALSQPVRQAAVIGLVVTVAGTIAAHLVGARQELIPQHGNLTTFPLVLGEWRGTEQPVEQMFLNTLKADDTLLATYTRPADPIPVGLWIAYYGSQREGRAVHSPKSCLPGGGWLIQSASEELLPDVRANGEVQPVNRVVMSQGQDSALVYYWFAQRGRQLTNEYLVKWYIFWDGLTRNRTDGALVRLTTGIHDADGGVEAADRRLRDFLREADPRLAYFLPQREAVMRVAGAD
jgi:exosortase D (VPLPA-CTERM-specific)